MFDTNRATGRTYRKALQLCVLASKGKSVLFVGGCNREISSMRALIRAHAPTGASVPMRGPSVLPGGGTITFRLASSCFTGAKFDAVVEDELLGMTWRHIEQYKKNIEGCGPIIGETV